LGFYGPNTPNIYNDWLAGNSVTVGVKANYFNVNDYALEKWQTDQVTKPDTRVDRYFYDSTNIDVVQDLFKKQALSGVIPLRLGDADNVQDRYEIMAYASEPRSKALGGVTAVVGFAPQNLQDQSVWPPDPYLGNNYSTHPWHSAQFRFTNAHEKNYWKTLMIKFGFTPNP